MRVCVCVLQRGAVVGPGGAAGEPGRAGQVGGADPGRRARRHGRAGAHAVRAGLRPLGQPARLPRSHAAPTVPHPHAASLVTPRPPRPPRPAPPEALQNLLETSSASRLILFLVHCSPLMQFYVEPMLKTVIKFY